MAHAIEKRRRGLGYGLLVGRTKNFRLPSHLLIGGRRMPIELPDEHGVRTSFAEVILSDVYGIERCGRNSFTKILDIGANVGIFTFATRKIHPRAVIHAYEPNVAVEQYLKANVSKTEATWFAEAVAGREGHGSLEIDPSESVQTQLVPDNAGTTPVVSLATAVERLGGADFVKIDCEGSEWEMFADAEPWHAIREVALEYHLRDGRTTEEAVSRVSALGLTPWRVSPGPGYGLILASRRSSS